MSNKRIILEEVLFDDYVIEDYHQYLRSKINKNTCIRKNKIESKIKPKNKINKEKIEDQETISLNNNWNDEYLDNHFLNYKNTESINLLEIK